MEFNERLGPRFPWDGPWGRMRPVLGVEGPPGSQPQAGLSLITPTNVKQFNDSPAAWRNQFEIYQIIPVDFIVPGLVGYFTWIFSPGILRRCGPQRVIAAAFALWPQEMP